jgi:hypothetical protein
LISNAHASASCLDAQANRTESVRATRSQGRCGSHA